MFGGGFRSDGVFLNARTSWLSEWMDYSGKWHWAILLHKAMEGEYLDFPATFPLSTYRYKFFTSSHHQQNEYSNKSILRTSGVESIIKYQPSCGEFACRPSSCVGSHHPKTCYILANLKTKLSTSVRVWMLFFFVPCDMLAISSGCFLPKYPWERPQLPATLMSALENRRLGGLAPKALHVTLSP